MVISISVNAQILSISELREMNISIYEAIDTYQNLLEKDDIQFTTDSNRIHFISLFQNDAKIVNDLTFSSENEVLSPYNYYTEFVNDTGYNDIKFRILSISNPKLVAYDRFEIECTVEKKINGFILNDSKEIIFIFTIEKANISKNPLINSINYSNKNKESYSFPKFGYFVISNSNFPTKEKALLELEKNKTHLASAEIIKYDTDHYIISEKLITNEYLTNAKIERIIREFANNYNLSVVVINIKYFK